MRLYIERQKNDTYEVACDDFATNSTVELVPASIEMMYAYCKQALEDDAGYEIDMTNYYQFTSSEQGGLWR